MTTKDMQNIMDRLEALEKAVFASGTSAFPVIDNSTTDYSGPRGGIRFLLTQGWFKVKKSLADVRKELAGQGYHYSRQAVHNSLTALSKPGGPLVALKEKGNKYVERK